MNSLLHKKKKSNQTSEILFSILLVNFKAICCYCFSAGIVLQVFK